MITINDLKKRYCKQCKKDTIQAIGLYDLDNTSPSEVWICSICSNETEKKGENIWYSYHIKAAVRVNCVVIARDAEEAERRSRKKKDNGIPENASIIDVRKGSRCYMPKTMLNKPLIK